MTELLLAARKCDQCLATRNRIVSRERAAQIISDFRASATHFVCHKADGEILHCRGVHDILLRQGGSRAYRCAVAFDIPIREVG